MNISQARGQINFSLFGFFFFVLTSCSSRSIKDEQGTWLEVKKDRGDYVINDCGDGVETIHVTKDSLNYHGIMEDVSVKINNIKYDNKTLIELDEKGANYFRFSWIDKTKGIAKWEMHDASNVTTSKHFVKSNYRNKLKTLSGPTCVEELGKKVNIKPDFVTADRKHLVKIVNNNCISMYDKNGEMVAAKCFAVDFLKIRQKPTKALPLTFISGKHAIEMDFIYNGKKWIAKKASYFSGGSIHGKTKRLDVRLENFDFDEVRTMVVD